MISLIFLASLTATDLDTLDSAVERCSRAEVSPVFAQQAQRQSQFMTDAYREQESIVADRLDIANRKRALREAGVTGLKGGDSLPELDLSAAAVEDRQRALNDKRLLESLRSDAMDAKRRYYLAHCSGTKE
nr:hypothetical protein [uncultured Sphingomonas sp.]